MPHYIVTPISPQAHHLQIQLVIEDPNPQGQVLSLPAWIPGSYLIREFARNILDIRVFQRGEEVPLIKVDKATWQVAPLNSRAALEVVYRVYAWDLSVRCAHFDDTHAFFNGTQVFLQVDGQQHLPQEVSLHLPADDAYADWKVATTLPKLHKSPTSSLSQPLEAPPHYLQKQAPAHSASHKVRQYRAADYDELVDHPVEMGRFRRLRSEIDGVLHEIAVTWGGEFDDARLLRDTVKICRQHMALFGPREPLAAGEFPHPASHGELRGTHHAPFSRYLFLLQATGDGYGGLEHRDSTALICKRSDLPRDLGDEEQESTPGEGYVRLLGLISHEYHHAWMVKRIKPAAFAPYDLAQENYTRLLWVFEGFTSYYDDLMVCRAGVIEPKTYLDLLGKTIASVFSVPGAQHQSLADASFDTWVKFYRPDENTPNRLVSYYTKGALVALCLDSEIRHRSGNQASLDDLLRLLWQCHGGADRDPAQGMQEDDIFLRVAELEARFTPPCDAETLPLAVQLRQWVEQPGSLPLVEALEYLGVGLEWGTKGSTPSLGIRQKNEEGWVKITHVLEDRAAMRAGLAAGDVLIALQGERVTPARLDEVLAMQRVGSRVEVLYARRDQIFTTWLVMDPPVLDQCRLFVRESEGDAPSPVFRQWLGGAVA